MLIYCFQETICAAGIGESKNGLSEVKLLIKTAAQANSYNESSNVGYGRYGSKGLLCSKLQLFSNYAKRIVYRGGLRYEKRV
jgi:hypothetical protein